MSVFDTIGRAGAAITHAHARRRAVRMLNNLPEEIQKDIGWPVSDHASENQALLVAVWNAAR